MIYIGKTPPVTFGSYIKTITPINLLSPDLDTRLSYTGPAHAYRNQSGLLSQSSVNQWPLEYINGIAIGRHLPESATTSLITDPRFTSLAGGSNAWMIAGGGVATLSQGTAIDGGNALRVSTTYSKPSIYNGSSFVTPDTTAWTTQNLDNSWVRKYVNGVFSAANTQGRFYPARQDSSNYVYFSCAITAGTVCMSEIRKPRGDSTDDLCLVQVEYSSLPSSPLLTGNTRGASSVVVKKDGNAQSITLHYNTGENTSLSFGQASSLSLPLSSEAWGLRYLTQITYNS